MIGYRETDTLGNKVFVGTSCEFCQMNTAGNHDYGCPNRESRIDDTISLYPERYYIGVDVGIPGKDHSKVVKTINPVKTEPLAVLEAVEEKGRIEGC